MINPYKKNVLIYIMFISHERRLDLKIRGKDCKVYDLDNKIVKLCEACVWFDNEGNYIKPRSYIFIISDIVGWYNSDTCYLTDTDE